ncbi:MAG TPA: 2-C-methyl-D-erythritol 4-phosphate cytidylyltransferase [Gemmatimonadaceae bacterium]|nr:2-C-methyl-D-erythritol 4-phosphate cytidylyltransferase [Gemmatimonadaceae bacterium]
MGISRHVPPPEPLRVFTVPARPSPVARDVGVIIVAAGQSTRSGAGELKQFRWVGGKPMLLHSVQTFLARSDVCAVVCVLPRQYVADPPPWLLQNDLDRLLLSVGGAERTDSVRNGLEDLVPDAKIVLVHDAARPLVTNETIDRVIAAARAGHGAVAALPVVDTLKEADASGRVVRTVDRTSLWRAQTPQGFPRDVIDQAYQEAHERGITGTDDAALVERLGVPVVVVRGHERALKVTEPGDFARAELLQQLRDGPPEP